MASFTAKSLTMVFDDDFLIDILSVIPLESISDFRIQTLWVWESLIPVRTSPTHLTLYDALGLPI